MCRTNEGGDERNKGEKGIKKGSELFTALGTKQSRGVCRGTNAAGWMCRLAGV